MEERDDCAAAERQLLVPTHMKHVTSLLSMEGLSSDGSQSDLEIKSRSSGIGLDLESPMSTPGPSEWEYGRYEDTDCESSPMCVNNTVNLKEYISDLTLLSHAALIGDVATDEKVSPYKHQPSRELDTSITENACTSTYERWKKLSGPIVVFVVLGLVILIWGRSHLVQLLQWLEQLPLHQSLPVFIVLFTLTSFPFGFGYIILNMMAGYLYGLLHGQLIVMVSVAVGVTISFLLCRSWFKDYARGMVTSNALQAVLKVVEGPHGFKVIFLTRFTPIPFGLQNVLFAVSALKVQTPLGSLLPNGNPHIWRFTGVAMPRDSVSASWS